MPFLDRLGLGRPDLRAWAMYDWANSAFQTTIIAAVFPIYYQKVAAAGLPEAVAMSRFAWATTLVVLVNFHRFLQSAEVVQALARQVVEGKQTRTIFLVLAPVVRIPIELEKLFTVVEHELPDREQLAEIARGVATEPEELPEGAEFERMLDAASGLTRYEAESAFSLGLVRERRLEAEPLWEQKAQMLRKSSALSLLPIGPS